MMLNLNADILSKAQDGDSFAQLDLGMAYYSSVYTENNCLLAFKWLSLSAEQGNMEAQFRLGNLYALGQGTTKNQSCAYEWYTKSAIQGYPKALVRLHNLYQDDQSMHCPGLKNENEYTNWQSSNELLKKRFKPHVLLILNGCIEYFKKQYEYYKKMDEPDRNTLLKLGFMSQHGYAVKKSIRRAIYFYSNAAVKYDCRDAQYNIGNIYQHNLKKEKHNYKKAFEWYSKAAKNGNVAAQSSLADLYEKGLGVEKNYSLALHWYAEASNNRYTDAQLNLAKMYRTGQGVSKDKDKAIKYYKLATQSGSMVAQNCLDQLLSQKNINPTKSEDSAFEEYKDLTNKRRMRALLRKHISNRSGLENEASLKKLAMNALIGDRNAMYEIGIKYQEGLELPQDDELSTKWIKRAGRANLDSAQIYLGKEYEAEVKNGEAVESDYYKASIWYKKGAKHGRNHELQFQLGKMYYYGQGVQRNNLEASKWFTMSSEQGNSDSQVSLGEMKTNGEGYIPDIKEGLNLHRQAIYQKNARAMLYMGIFYRYSKNDIKEAIRFFKYAEKYGEEDATLQLLDIYDELQIENGNNENLLKGYDPTESIWKIFNSNNYVYNWLCFKTAQFYLEGKLFKKDYIKAYTLLKRSAELSAEIHSLGGTYFKSPVIIYQKTNCTDLLNMFKLVSQKGIESLEYNIGYTYEFGILDSLTYEVLNTIDVSEAIKWYVAAAEKDDSRAQYRLGVIYEEGKGVSQNLDTAMSFYIKATEKENPDAMYRLACLYLQGSGLKQDFKKAFDLFMQSHNMGQVHSRLFLKVSSKNNEGKRNKFELSSSEEDENAEKYYANKKESDALATEMLSIVAQEGNIALQYRLGSLYEEANQFVEIDYQKAVYWYTLASQNGVTQACYRLGVLYEKGQGIEKNYKEARRLYVKASEKKHEKALFRSAQLFHHGRGVEVDLQKAFELYKEATIYGNEESEKITAFMETPNDESTEVPLLSSFEIKMVDIEENLDLYEYIANTGNTHLQVKLGILNENTETEKGYAEAFKWFTMASNNFHSYGIYRLGSLHEEGLGVPQSYKQAIELYERAHKQGCVKATYRLGKIYQNGHDDLANNNRAFEYFMKAATQGDEDAQFKLGQLYSTQNNTKGDAYKMLEWLTKSYTQGNDDAMEPLYSLYDDEKPYETFFHTKLIANLVKYTKNKYEYLDHGDYADPIIYYKLACMYLTENYIRKDREKAWESFRTVIMLAFNSYSIAEEWDIYDFFDGFISELHDIARKKEEMNDIYACRFLGYTYFRGIMKKYDNKKPNKMIYSPIYEMDTTLSSDNSRSNPNSICITIVPKDYKIAYQHFKKAADGGDDFSMLMVGQMYQCGYGVKQDFVEAMDYYSKIEENTSIFECYAKPNINLLHALGDGVKQDIQLLRNPTPYYPSWVRLYNLAQLHYHGYGFDQNYRSALKLLIVAEDDMEPIPFCVVVSATRVEGNESTTKNQREYVIMPPDVLKGEIHFQIGTMMENGQGTRKNYVEAFKRFTKAVEYGNSKAQDHLKSHYKNGVFIENQII